MPDRHNTKTYVELEMLVGHDAAEKLINEYRGQEVYISAPDKLHDEHKLVKLLGLDVAKRLSYYWQDTILTLPIQLAKTLTERNHEIVAKHKAGADTNDLAKAYGLHVRTVRKIIAKHKTDQARAAYARMQLGLFDY